MLQAGCTLGEVSLSGQFPVCGFALNVGLLQSMRQQGQVLEQLASVEVLLHSTDRPATDVSRLRVCMPAPSNCPYFHGFTGLTKLPIKMALLSVLNFDIFGPL